MIDTNLFEDNKINFSNSLANIIVFGPGYGESIILFLPGLGWGIIDSCTVTFKKKTYNPALEYLKALNVKGLAFIILTHPHLDHYKGLAEIVDHYLGRIDRICYYSGEGLREYRAYLARKSILSEPGLKSLAFILDHFKKAKEHGANIVKISERTEIIRKREFGDHIIEMIALSPSEDSIKAYCEKLYDCIPNDDSSPIKNIKDRDQNLISTAIWCKIDDRTFIFGSDLENGFSIHSGWNGVLNNIDSPNLSSSFVKIPHHGSPNAYDEKLWKAICKLGKPNSVVTPFSSTKKSPLPNRDVLEKIKDYSKEVYITSQAKLEKPKKIYKDIPFENSYGIRSWYYIKYPQQVGFVKAIISTKDNSVDRILLNKPAYKFDSAG